MTSTHTDRQTQSTYSGQKPTTRGGMQDVIYTRFGTVPALPDQQVRFKGGLPGFPEFETFQLEQIADVKGDLLLLQSVETPEVAFFVLPLTSDNDVLSEEDLSRACKQCGLEQSSTKILLVVNLMRDEAGVLQKFVNLRAPILIDAAKQLGSQIVLNCQDYPVRLQL